MKVISFLTQVNDSGNLIIRNVPVSSTIVEINDNSLAIIDTGMANNPQLLQEIKSFGYDLSDFKLVINTHMHCDHIGGNALFKNARILISQKDYEYQSILTKRLQASSNPVKTLVSIGYTGGNISPLIARDMKNLADKYPVSLLVGSLEQMEFFEDYPLLPTGFSLISTPGHSIASYTVCLTGSGQTAIITGDALYHRDLWKISSIPGINYDEKLFQKTAMNLAKTRGIIIPGHDYPFNNINGHYLQENTLII